MKITFFKGALTRGVRDFLTENECFWFADVICSYQGAKLFKGDNFQVWKLKKAKSGPGCTITCEDGNDNILAVQKIPATTYTGENFKVYLVDKTILFPNEY